MIDMEQIHHGTTVRLRDERLAIYMGTTLDALGRLSMVACDGVMQVVKGPGIAAAPAVCPLCGQSHWWWAEDLLPKCRTCHPPSDDWQFNLLPLALAAVKQLDGELAPGGKTWMENSFVTGDVDALQRISGLFMVDQAFRKTYHRYFEKLKAK